MCWRRPVWGEGEQNGYIGPAVQLKLIVRIASKIVVIANATPKAIEERIAKLRREGKALAAPGPPNSITIARHGYDRIMRWLRRSLKKNQEPRFSGSYADMPTSEKHRILRPSPRSRSVRKNATPCIRRRPALGCSMEEPES